MIFEDSTFFEWDEIKYGLNCLSVFLWTHPAGISQRNDFAPVQDLHAPPFLHRGRTSAPVLDKVSPFINFCPKKYTHCAIQVYANCLLFSSKTYQLQLMSKGLQCNGFGPKYFFFWWQPSQSLILGLVHN